MNRIGIRCLLLAALVTGSLAATTGLATAAKSATPAPSSRSKYAYHQFTGFITAVDKQSLTVEKRGKQTMSRTFARHEAMTATGDLAREARVTVFYRDEDGKAVAHKVVVKEAAAETAAN